MASISVAQPKTDGLPSWQAGLIGGVAATALNLVVATVGGKALTAPDGYAPLTFLPVFSGSFGGVIAATAVYALIRRVSPKPMPVILGLTLAVLVASAYLPMRLLRPNVGERFAGVTPEIAELQFVMHSLVALVSLAALSRTRRA